MSKYQRRSVLSAQRLLFINLCQESNNKLWHLAQPDSELT